ncbi:L,D-transpeptidase [Amycolatopsis nigrescens]|uniref:L,D-transpeptidase n=1 Tax=Amycolatopsis nigrescens TaxID=381445 RepID=UPI000361663B|nr:L,D-transpeptidase [Amycolatopsis nigrescens]
MRKMNPSLLIIGLCAVATACSAAETAQPVVQPAGPPHAAPVTLPSTPRPATAPCTAPGTVACVSLSEMRAWLLRDGTVTHGPVPIMPGKPGGPTPVGTFRVEWKDKDHVSKEFAGAPMPNSVFFAAGGIAFHAGSLVDPSNGCVHLGDADSLKFFDTLGKGDVVQVLP